MSVFFGGFFWWQNSMEDSANRNFWRIFGAQKFGSEFGDRIWLGALTEATIQCTLLLVSMPDTEYMYMRNFPPDDVDGEHSPVSGSCSLPQLWPDETVNRLKGVYDSLQESHRIWDLSGSFNFKSTKDKNYTECPQVFAANSTSIHILSWSQTHSTA